jgi:hypothetical protein
MSIRNPRYKEPDVRKTGQLTTGERATLRAAIAAAVAALPEGQPVVTLHELAITVRAAGTGLAPDAFDGGTIAALLAELGYEVTT